MWILLFENLSHVQITLLYTLNIDKNRNSVSNNGPAYRYCPYFSSDVSLCREIRRIQIHFEDINTYVRVNLKWTRQDVNKKIVKTTRAPMIFIVKDLYHFSEDRSIYLFFRYRTWARDHVFWHSLISDKPAWAFILKILCK